MVFNFSARTADSSSFFLLCGGNLTSTELGFHGWRRASIFKEINSKPSGKVSVADTTVLRREAGALADIGMDELTDEVVDNLPGSTKQWRNRISSRRAVND